MSDDGLLWLEEVEGDAALGWVRAQNERTTAALGEDPGYAALEAAALEVLTADDRIPRGTIVDGQVYNFWQDERNVRGVWRRSPLESFRRNRPAWETLLDVDALAEAEGANWVFKGVDVFRPPAGAPSRCLVSLSDGGKDAIVLREFDLASYAFVDGGFESPAAKQSAAWVDADTLLLATDWGDEDEPTVTGAGYPFIVKRWTRGTPLAEATEVFRGAPTDIVVVPFVLDTADGSWLVGAMQADTLFTPKDWLLLDDGPVALPTPRRSRLNGVSHGRFLVTLEEDWQPQDEQFCSGDLVAFDVATFLEQRELPQVELVFRPSPTQAVGGVAVASAATVLSITDDVVGRVLRLEATDAGWSTTPIELPGTGSVGIAFSSAREPVVLLTYEDFLTPPSLLGLHSATGEVDTMAAAPAKFDAEGLVVEQRHAISADGTRVPHFVVRRADVELDGSTPTILHGYGGFQVALKPSYDGTLGRNWLADGGAFVVANIRGGGEFGPAWHQAGVKANRQRAYEDFIAVAESIIESGLTLPEHLGIIGGSNGGLLMGVMLNQRPDLWGAAVVQVPLLDMLRFHLLLAGASWVDEFGSPDDPEERAFLETISPVHNFDAALPYPPPLFVTSTKDDRVHPGHARKLAKRFEDAGLDFWYYENIDGGHAAAANHVEAARRTALEFTYLKQQLGG